MWSKAKEAIVVGEAESLTISVVNRAKS